jgi:hypothetical protein
MGRKSKTIEEKKGKLSITISTDNYNQMETNDINKSKLINWLLEEYFKSIK